MPNSAITPNWASMVRGRAPTPSSIPQQLQKMPELKRPAAAGQVWYEQQQQDRFVRVLWSETARYRC